MRPFPGSWAAQGDRGTLEFQCAEEVGVQRDSLERDCVQLTVFSFASQIIFPFFKISCTTVIYLFIYLTLLVLHVTRELVAERD